MSNKLFIKDRLVKGLMELDQKKIVGGVLIKCVETENIFLVLRNDKVPTWALVSGKIEKDENTLEGLKREVHEELAINPNDIEYKFVHSEHIPERNMAFNYFEGFTNSEFKPILDHENLKWGWFPKDKLPTPLYKGLGEKIAKI